MSQKCKDDSEGSLINRHQRTAQLLASEINLKQMGPFLFNESVNGDRYLTLLQESVGPHIEEMFGDDDEIDFQQDGAPPHYHREVRYSLSKHMDWTKG